MILFVFFHNISKSLGDLDPGLFEEGCRQFSTGKYVYQIIRDLFDFSTFSVSDLHRFGVDGHQVRIEQYPHGTCTFRLLYPAPVLGF